MKKNAHSKNKFLHYSISFFLFPAAAGTLTGAVVFFFKLLAERLMELSNEIYAFVAEKPIFIPLLLVGVCVIALASFAFYKLSHLSSGGGIPTAIAALRGLLPFKWIRTFFCVLASSVCTYLAGMPLDTEGPAVQIGACIGRGVSRTSSKKFKGSDRYIMTGGACAGIAVATGAPISGIFFALEDSHRRFTPTIFISASVGVICGIFSSKLLEKLFGISFSGFITPDQVKLEIKHAWIVILIALVAVLLNTVILFIFKSIKSKKEAFLTRMPKWTGALILIGLFVITALCGVFFRDALGTGHTLTNEIILGNRVWYLLAIAMILRSILVPSASVGNVTGGLFVPLITFGAITGALCAQGLIVLGVIDADMYGSLIVIGIGSFLSVAHKTPITAILFTVEMFGGIVNAPYLILAVTVAYILSELLNEESINDAVMENSVEKIQKLGKKEIFDVNLTVQKEAFVIGMETRDILWPAQCRVLNIRSAPDAPQAHGIKEGDIIHIHFLTYDFDRTAKELCSLLGDQYVPKNYSTDMK